MSVSPLRRCAILGALVLAGVHAPAAPSDATLGWSFDTGADAAGTAALLIDNLHAKPPAGSWLRIRGLDTQPPPDQVDALRERTRAGLVSLRDTGYHVVAIVHWPTESWKTGVRQPARENRLPADLREAHDRCRQLAATYGDLVDYWEIDNEPDISFVQENPETYTAYLKACYLGIGAGKAEIRNRNERSSASEISASQHLSISAFGSSISSVLMAPLALPPGPYLEAFIANDGLSYTDGFNYHYYGYAEDFTGVYRQFEATVAGLAPETPYRAAGEIRQSGRSAKRGAGQSELASEGPSEARVIEPGALRAGEITNAEGLTSERLGAGVPKSGHQTIRPSAHPTSAAPARWRSRFFPSADGWVGTTTARFDHAESQAEPQIKALEARPLAQEEPPVTRQGRWLVSQGVKVEEKDGVWRFTIDRWPDGPLRAPYAELALPAGWAGQMIGSSDGRMIGVADAEESRAVGGSPLAGSLISFQYRRVDTPGPKVVASAAIDPARQSVKAEDGRPRAEDRLVNRADLAVLRSPQSSVVQGSKAGPAVPRSETDQTIRPSDNPNIRQLPIFLTEYGYASLDKVTRHTAEGRERQRAWFASVRRQIRELGIEGAMPFVLKPYLERDLLEFGLLADVAAHPDARRLDGHAVTPALDGILETGGQPLIPKRWKVATPPPATVVIDFIAGKGLGQAKSYGGYFLEGQAGRAFPAEGELVVYNFGAEPVRGEVRLSGNGWRFLDGTTDQAGSASPIAHVTLAPGERLRIPVRIAPQATKFIASEVVAEFLAATGTAPEIRKTETPVNPTARLAAEHPKPAMPQPNRAPATPAPPTGALNMFECYFRTENGNLYQTWPRLLPTGGWQVYMQRMENFTMAFYGRTVGPWRFLENRPVSLAFFFHPDELPVTYEVLVPSLSRFAAPD